MAAVLLKRLYSETDLFDEITFHLGINIISGIYKTGRKETGDISGIGKSTLVRLIDFSLLSDTAQNNFFDPKNISFLKGHSVTLEFSIENTVYFIKRTFDNPKEAEFGENLLNLRKYNTDDLRFILGDLFFFDSDYSGDFDSGWFRNLIKFFIKDDLTYQKRSDPLNFLHSNIGKFELYSYHFFLLGLNNKPIKEYHLLKDELKNLRSQRNKTIHGLTEETGKRIEEVNLEIAQINKKIEQLENSIESYRFLSSYENIERELISISGEISSLLKESTFLQKKLNEYQESYKFILEIDKNKVINLYSEVNKTFGSVVKKQLDEVLEFRATLAENRSRFLKSKEKEFEEKIDDLKTKVSSLEKRRSFLYGILNEKKALDSIKNTYELLIDEKTKKERLLSVVSSIDKLDEKINQKQESVSKIVSDIYSEIHSDQNKINQISSLFLEIVQNAIPNLDTKETIFYIKSKTNIGSPMNITIQVPKSNAYGRNRFTLLAYELTVFLNIIRNDRKLPHFLIHDGIFHGISIGTVVNILNYIYSQYLMYPTFQYIITANENEIFVPEEKKELYGTYKFEIEKYVRKTYQDNPEDMIFKREY
jgi:uncharacterized protein YydD (DUF2326 family)